LRNTTDLESLSVAELTELRARVGGLLRERVDAVLRSREPAAGGGGRAGRSAGPEAFLRRVEAVKRRERRERALLALLAERGAPVPVREYQFHVERRWRFDWAWPEQRVALEVEGGAYAGGRHVRGSGFFEDCEKYSEAAAAGWLLVRVPPQWVDRARTVEWIERALSQRSIDRR
jgi:hypothetical protein